MRRFLISFCMLLLFAVLLLGCTAVVPTIRVWRPWTRTLESPQVIRAHASISISVLGETSTLLGDEALLKDHIRAELGQLLERRGYQVVDAASDYHLTLRYHTREKETLRMFSMADATSYSTSVSAVQSGAGAKSGLGIAVAQAVASMASASLTVAGTSLEKSTILVHTLALELATTGNPVWKADVNWESSNPDLLYNLKSNLQTALSSIPADTAVVPTVLTVKRSHARNFVRLYCEDTWFSCPALPFWISLENETVGRVEVFESDFDSTALAAFVDLIQTAEYAVPEGDDDWTDPLKPGLWKKVLLGGRYRLLPDNRMVNVFVRLRGNSAGYRASRCWIASDAEYEIFRGRLSLWQQALQRYYDVFAR
jgi:hypothetical protein